MPRSGQNIGGYHGERIDIHALLENVKSSAARHGWQQDAFAIPNGADLPLYRRSGSHARRRLYLSSGIHGDEPAGPCAILQLLQENLWPNHVDLWLCPLLNLTGFPLNRRENAAGVDLNRDYRHLNSAEIRTHAAWLQQQPEFDVAVCLHEDWEANGFYLYEQNPEQRPSLAPPIIAKVAEVCPIETGPVVDGWPIRDGIIRPDIHPPDRPQWPEALFLITHKTRLAYTLESPSDFSLAVRIQAQVVAVRAILASL